MRNGFNWQLAAECPVNRCINVQIVNEQVDQFQLKATVTPNHGLKHNIDVVASVTTALV